MTAPESAAAAWRASAAGGRPPLWIQTIGQPGEKKSSVFRLGGAEAGGGNVIAKQAKATSIEVEVRVYREILPSLPIASARCLGASHSEDDQSWIFLSEVDGAPWSFGRAEHRKLASAFLARLHSSTATAQAPSFLPECTPSRYLSLLQRAEEALLRDCALPTLEQTDRQFLLRLRDAFQELGGRWGGVEALAAEAPQCLVHGDFIPKNLQVIGEAGAAELVAIDWEAAGWGCPCEDLAMADPAFYFELVTLPSLTRRGADMLFALGRAFHAIAWVQATATLMTEGWQEPAVDQLKAAGEVLELARRELAL